MEKRLSLPTKGDGIVAKRKKSKSKYGWTVYLILGLLFCTPLLLVTASRYNFPDTIYPLWYIALGVAVAVGTFLCALCIKKLRLIGAGIGVFFGTVLVLFFLLGPLFAHVNHLFDPHEPVQYTVTVEAMKVSRGGGRRSMSHYKITACIDGERITVQVPRAHYVNLKEGDPYVIEHHQGLFDEPYYIGVLPHGAALKK